jgi:proton glutamate symport protein
VQLYTKILIGMLVGALLGFLLGPNSRLLSQTAVVLPARVEVLREPGSFARVKAGTGLRYADIVEESAGPPPWLRLEWKLTSRDTAKLTAAGIETKAGTTHTGWVRADTPGLRRISPLGQTLVDYTEWIGRLFVAMIKLVVVPLVFFSLVVGVASLGDPRKLGRMGGLTIGYFICTTVLALLIGLGLANLIRPGELLSSTDRRVLMDTYSSDASDTLKGLADSPRLVDQLVAVVPKNPFEALARGDMLAVIFVAILLGIAFTLMNQQRAERAVSVFDSLNEAMVTIVHIAMKLAPYGVAALLFEVVGSTGMSVLLALGAYALVVLAGLLLHITLVYAPVMRLLVKLPFFGFLRAIRAALVLAFSTSSSSATLPVTKQSCETNLKVSEQVSSFVLPIGATVNMDGTALYQGVAAVFIAQIYGMELTALDQAKIVVSATLASVGAAGVPGAGMITLAMVLTTIGVPTQGIALVLGVDRVLDMFRTTTNVIGDCTATALVARTQGEKLQTISPRIHPERTEPETP